MYGDKEVTEILNFCMITDIPGGMPWSVWKKGEEHVDNGRRCFMFQVDRRQLPRLKKVLEYAKMNNKWEKHFNNRVVSVEMIPT